MQAEANKICEHLKVEGKRLLDLEIQMKQFEQMKANLITFETM